MTPQTNRRTAFIHPLLLAFALGFILSSAGAQDMSQYDHGTPPQHVAGVSSLGSYTSTDIGTVNLSNGALNLKLPLGSVGGRGFTVPLTLNYSSKVWSASRGSDVSGTGSAPVVYAAYADADGSMDFYNRVTPGWTVGAQPLLRSRSIAINPVPDPRSCGSNYMLTTLTLVLPDKGEVSLRDDLTDGAPLPSISNGQCLVFDGNRGQRWHATDGSGIIYVSNNANGVVNGNLAGHVIMPDGTHYQFGAGQIGSLPGVPTVSRCKSIIDRNGNTITISYPSQNEVDYTDQLGRLTTVRYNVADPEGVYGRLALLVTLPGYSGQPRYFKVIADQMSNHYRPGIRPALPVINGDADPLGYGYLFAGNPTRLFPNSYGKYLEFIDREVVVTQLALPDGRTLRFNYNEYGEVAEVVLPTGGSVQYDYGPATLPAGNTQLFELTSNPPIQSDVFNIDRAVAAMRTYPNGATPEATWSYTYGATAFNGTGYPSTEVTCRAGTSQTVLLEQVHYFLAAQRYLARAPGLGLNAPPDGTGYSKWSTGVEWRTETRNGVNGAVLAASEQDFAQRTALNWTATTYAQEQPENDNRVSASRKYLDDGSMARTTTLYEAMGDPHTNSPTDVTEYDYDGTAKRETQTQYVKSAAYVNDTVHLVGLPSQATVYDGGGAMKAQTVYEYDTYNATDGNHAALQGYGTVSGHDETQYGLSYLTRGNVTKTHRWVAGSTFLDTYPRYDVLGNVISIKDPRLSVTTISYADDFGDGSNPGSHLNNPATPTYALPTLLTSPPPNLGEPPQTAASQYDYGSGLLIGFKDRNGVITQTLYNDPFDRPTLVKTALGSGLEQHTAMYYAGTPNQPPLSYGVTLANNDVLTAKDQAVVNDGNLRSWTQTDGFGRVTANFTHDLEGDVQVATAYDGLGRAAHVTNPYRSTADLTYGYADTTYDLLGRVKTVTTSDGAVVRSDYLGRQVTVTDQAGKVRRSFSDALGRLTQVIEDPTVGGLAYSTTYSYDALDDLTGVQQGVQPRTFLYDGLKRLTDATNPESSHVQYGYDGNGNLVTKTDGRGITTTYAYDALNRLKSKSYTNDPQTGQGTSAVSYYYDGQSVPTLPAGSPAFNRGASVGRLVATTYGGGNLGTYQGYDGLGRVAQSLQVSDPQAGGTPNPQAYGMSYGYNLAGAMVTEAYPSGRIVQSDYDATGRLAGVKNQATGLYYAGGNGTDAANRMQYAAQGAVAAMRLGNGRWEHTTYNTRLQPIEIGLGTSASDSSLLKLGYGYGTSNNNGNMLTQTITVGAAVMTQTYSYDALNRLQSASESAVWLQSYGYDRYGNRAVTASTGYALNPLTPVSLTQYNAGSNRLTANGYDLAGNQTQEGSSRTFTYDAENRQLTFNGTVGQYVYDGDGRRVKKIDSSGTTVFVYDAGGRLVAEYTSGAASGSGTSYMTGDHLGSTRAVTKADGSVKARYDYLPFGEELGAGIGQRTSAMGYGGSDTTRQKFTAKERDNESGLDYFIARYYSSAQGRFTSADNFLNDTTATDPASWNLYVYVRNNPLRYTDPSGEKIYVGDVTGSDRDELLRRLNFTYGCNCVSVDKDGYLQVDTSGLNKDVAEATQYLTDAINSTSWFAVVQITNNNSDVAFGDSQAGAAAVQLPGKSFKRSAVRIRLDFGDDQWVSGDQRAREAFLNTVFAHEVAHFYPTHRTDPTNDPRKTGPVVDAVNEILQARGLSLRANYASSAQGGYWLAIPHGEAERDKKSGEIIRKGGGIQVKVTEAGNVIRWLKRNVGGTGVN